VGFSDCSTNTQPQSTMVGVGKTARKTYGYDLKSERAKSAIIEAKLNITCDDCV